MHSRVLGAREADLLGMMNDVIQREVPTYTAGTGNGERRCGNRQDENKRKRHHHE